jgi:hypothetical protein
MRTRLLYELNDEVGGREEMHNSTQTILHRIYILDPHE